MRNVLRAGAAFAIAVVAAFLPAVFVGAYLTEYVTFRSRFCYALASAFAFLIHAIALGVLGGLLVRSEARMRWSMVMALLAAAVYTFTFLHVPLRRWPYGWMTVTALLAAGSFAITARRARRSAPDPHDLHRRMH